MDFGNETVLKVTGIAKKYDAAKALDKVSIEIKRGMIYSLIRENGVGKSTLMRTIMGLILIDGDSIELFGATDLQATRQRMGQSIETPALYPELTARDNLHIQAVNGGVSNRGIEDPLKIVRLESTGKKKTKNFPLGMRQRSAIANALITNPEFLILDEPTNRIDPAGMAEMREIIQRLVKERGIAVLLSSYLPDELSQITTYYGILHEGYLIKELSREELAQESRQFVEIGTSAAEQAITVLDSLGYRGYFVQSSRVIQLFKGINQIAAINQVLAEVKVPVGGIRLVGQKLEDCFLQSAGGNPHV